MRRREDAMEALARVSRLYREDIRQHKLATAEDVAANQVLARFRPAEVLQVPNYLTVQVSETEHILLDPQILQYVNHSCDPNVYFDTATMELVSLKPIVTGEELTFFYPSTEWDMAASFECHCGSPDCLGEIQGARYLAPQVLRRYRLTPHILRLLHFWRGRETSPTSGA